MYDSYETYSTAYMLNKLYHSPIKAWKIFFFAAKILSWFRINMHGNECYRISNGINMDLLLTTRVDQSPIFHLNIMHYPTLNLHQNEKTDENICRLKL